jgi:virginiamycin B lyase
MPAALWFAELRMRPDAAAPEKWPLNGAERAWRVSVPSVRGPVYGAAVHPRQGPGRVVDRLILCVLVIVAVSCGSAALASSAQAYIYWSDYGSGFAGGGTTLGRANGDGNAVNPGFITGAANPAGLAADAGHLYWSENGTAIARANLDGSGANEGFITGTGGNVVGIAVDSAHIYWTDGSRYVARANLDGSGVNGHFIDTGSTTYPEGITVSSGFLYVGEAGQIVKVAATGGTPSTFVPLSSGSETATSLTVVSGYLYWTDFNPGVSAAIGRVPLSGVGANASFIPSLQWPMGIASDGTYIYWTDIAAKTIGRARLDGTQADASFISDPGGPAGLAIDAGIDPTGTSVSCTPAVVAAGGASACTAAVSDSASSEPPSGTVVFSGGSGTFFPGGNSCTLTAHPGSSASCTVGAEATTTGIQTLTASYQGDATHAASTSSSQFCAGGSAVCGGGPPSTSTDPSSTTPSKPAVVCKVPKMKGKTLSQARKLLSAAHCRLGKVTSPRRKKGQRPPALIVRSQSPSSGRILAAAGRVSVRLMAKPKPSRRKHR